MKTFCFIFSFLLISILSFGQFRNVQIQAAGLTCSMCSNAINKALKPLPFVAGIKTDLSKNLFIITIKDGTSPNFDLLKNKVEGAGFSVAKMNVDVKFDNLAVANDTHISIGNKTLHFLNVKSQTLSGWQTVQLIDKNFVLDKEHKKMGSYTSMACFKTGKASACCSMGNALAGERIFHITI